MARYIPYCRFYRLDPSFSILKTEAGPAELELVPSIEPNGIGSFTWRWEQSQLPKRSDSVFNILNDGSSPEKQQHGILEFVN
jgi:hypothetical protein